MIRKALFEVFICLCQLLNYLFLIGQFIRKTLFVSVYHVSVTYYSLVTLVF